MILQLKARNLPDESVEIEQDGGTTFEENPSVGFTLSFEWSM